jgi:hypothetical protein
LECKRLIIVYNIDSLLGMDESQSDSSIVNQNMCTYLRSQFCQTIIDPSQSDQTTTKERWSVAIVRNSFVLEKFAAIIEFQLTEDQNRENEEYESHSSEILFCVKCHDHFSEAKNEIGACNYYDGFLDDSLPVNSQKLTPSQATTMLKEEELFALTNDENQEKIDQQKNRLKYICCHATFQIDVKNKWMQKRYTWK